MKRLLHGFDIIGANKQLAPVTDVFTKIFNKDFQGKQILLCQKIDTRQFFLS